jgi:hypothetical protein
MGVFQCSAVSRCPLTSGIRQAGRIRQAGQVHMDVSSSISRFQRTSKSPDDAPWTSQYRRCAF